MSDGRTIVSTPAWVMLERPLAGGAAVARPSLAMIADAATTIAGHADDESVGEAVVAQVAQVLQASDVRLVLFDADRQWLRVRYAVGRSQERLGERQPTSHAVLTTLLGSGEAVLLGAPNHSGDIIARASDAWRAAALVRLKGMVHGYLVVERAPDLPPYVLADLPVLQMLADLAGLRLGYSALAVRPRQRERELAEMAPHWRPPVDQAGDFVMVTDLQGRVLDADAAACRLLGYSRDELRHLSIPDISPVPFGVDAQGALQVLYERVRESDLVSFESSVRRRDDTLFPIRLQLEAVESAGVPAVRAVCWDLTERKEAHARLLHTERLRILGQMASGVAHDLNNTLAHVLGNLQLLLDSISHPGQRALLERVQQAAIDGAETVRRLHSFTRSRDTQAELIDLSAVVTEVAELTRPSWEAATQQHGVPVALVVETQPVPPVLGNAAELREVLVNLVQNALDALPTGGTVWLRTTARESEVCVIVTDNGVGMPPRVRHRIFDPFFTTKGQKGSGLGLSIAYTIIARHKGDIAVESEEGQGTTFTVRLPVAAEPADRPLLTAAPATTVPKGDRSRRHGRVLTVDDERDLAVMLARMLQGDGHDVRVCTRGAEALDLLDREAFDVLLTDVSMPDMDGWEVARQAKERHPDLSVAVVTGWGPQYEGMDMAAKGIDYVLSKPFTVTAARELVAQALADHPAEPAG
jgi:PAS domain S-box-containing protein